MKKMLCLIIAICVGVSSTYALDFNDNLFVGSLGFDMTVPTDRGDESFKGVDGRVEYKKYFANRFYVSPGLSLNYESHDCHVDGLSGGANFNRFGAGISAFVGYTIPVYEKTKWDIYLGPTFRYLFITRTSYKGETLWDNKGDSHNYKWYTLRCTFGARYNIGRIFVGAEYGLTLTPFYASDKGFDTPSAETDLLSIRLGYNF